MKKMLTDKVINRLTLYHCILTEYIEKDIEYISSPRIAGLLKIDDSQVRKDIKLLNSVGKCKVGYVVQDLKEAIEHTLGFSKTKSAFIVGSGNLGMALAKYDSFSNYGLNIVALFDTDPIKINLMVNGKQVFHLSKFSDLTKKMNVEIAILTVPRQVAQKTADLLVASGIKYIWNFSPSILSVPEDVQVWNENLMGNFLQFTANNKNTK